MEIVVKDLYKSFDGHHVLKGMSLAIPPGKITVIIGGSGSGKSVFLKHLIGLMKPDKGSVKIDGQEITHLREKELLPLRKRIGYIFQGGALLASLTVVENVALGLMEGGNGMTRAEALHEAKLKLAMVDMSEAADKMPGDLSGGMRKRASVARALTMDPECILYDEPTAGLDPPRSRQIEDVIMQVNKDEKRTSIVVTHDMESVKLIADQVFMLYQGEIIFEGTGEELFASKDPRARAFVDRTYDTSRKESQFG